MQNCPSCCRGWECARWGVRGAGRCPGQDRFGSAGQQLHGLAAGVDPRPVNGRTPPPELSLGVDFEPPLTLIEQVAFASRAMVERFVKQLSEAGLVATEVRVELATENDEFCAKTWASPTSFEAAGLSDRIRWQAQAAAGTQITAAITAVHLEPVAVDAAAHHAPGLFGLGPDERVHHAMSRVQSMLGPDQVLRPRIAGTLAGRAAGVAALGIVPVIPRRWIVPGRGSCPRHCRRQSFPSRYELGCWPLTGRR